MPETANVLLSPDKQLTTKQFKGPHEISTERVVISPLLELNSFWKGPFPNQEGLKTLTLPQYYRPNPYSMWVAFYRWNTHLGINKVSPASHRKLSASIAYWLDYMSILDLGTPGLNFPYATEACWLTLVPQPLSHRVVVMIKWRRREGCMPLPGNRWGKKQGVHFLYCYWTLTV